MTSSYMTSVLTSKSYRHSRVLENIYQVYIEDFDGDIVEYEVTANSFDEAAQEASSLAYNDGTDIYNMNIYLLN